MAGPLRPLLTRLSSPSPSHRSAPWGQVRTSPPALMATEPLTELETAIETVVTTFFTFAGREGRKGSLSINEFKELVTQQLPHLLKVGGGGVSGPEVLRDRGHGTLPVHWSCWACV